ncbi:MAG: signal recognition particle protein [Dehalococcoidia bacterium]|nr:signal recognition particle protein [Dehalococcoidia bacterium]
MFDALTDKLTAVFTKLGSHGRLTEKDVDEALREVRLALLEADVNFKVVKDLQARIRARCLGVNILEGLSPAQQVIKIVMDEFVAVLSGRPVDATPEQAQAYETQVQRGLISSSPPPHIIMMVGLQGSGKTTTTAKLALNLRKQGQKALMIAADIYRPAAIEQLTQLGAQLDIPVYSEGTKVKAWDIATHGVQKAKELGINWILIDTAGRLHIDEDMMQEVAEIKNRLKPENILLVVDAMTGQDAVRAAEEFKNKVGVNGLIMTKLDGDARGGAALSIASVTGVPVKFIGVGEKIDALEIFHADRVGQRILGMGDIQTLAEKAQDAFDEKKAKELEKKMKNSTFDLDDFLGQLQQVKKMGSLSQIMDMIPGMGAMAKKMPGGGGDDAQMKKVEAIIYSMTPHERKNSEIIGGSRRKRIAAGSGTTPADVNRLLTQFKQAKDIMKRLQGGKLRIPGMPNMPR